jgi:hypothetical protein
VATLSSLRSSARLKACRGRKLISIYPPNHSIGTDATVLEPLRARYNAQHFNLRKFYYECSNLKYLTGLINVPKLGQEPPNLLDNGSAPDLPDRPKTAAPKPSTPAPPPQDNILDSTAEDIAEQKRMLEGYEAKQQALVREREAAQRRQREEAERLEREHAEQLRMQQEQERRQQEELMRQQQMQQQQQQQQQYQQVDQGRQQQMEMEMLGMRGQYERDQMMLEQYDRVSVIFPFTSLPFSFLC